MPILVLTEAERLHLYDVLEVHLDGLRIAKEECMTSLDGPDMLEAVAAVDEAIARNIKVQERINRAI